MLRRTAKRKDTPQQHHHHNHTFSSPPLRTKPLPIGAPSPAAQTPPTASPQGSIAASYSPGHRPYAAHPRVSESSTIASPFPSSASIDSMPPLPGPSTGPGHGHGHAQPHPQGQHMGRSQSAFNFLLSKARAPFSSASNPSGMATSTSLSSLPNHLEDAASTDSLAGAHRDGTSFTYHRPWPTPTERPSLHEAKPPPLTRPSMSDEPSVSSPTKRGFFSGVGRERKVSNASAGKGGPIKGSFANSPLGKATRSEGLQSGSPQAYGLFSKSQSDLHSRPEFPSPGTVPVELPRVSSPAPMAPEDRAFLRSPSPNVGYSRSVDDLSQMNGPYPAFPGHSPQQFGGRIKPTGEHGFVTGQWRPSDLGTLPAREASRTASSTHARSESLMSRAQTSPSPSNQQASGLQQDTDWPQVPQIPAQHLHAPAQSSSRHQRKTSKAQSGNSREPTQGRSQGHMSIASSLGLGGMASATACTVVDKVHSFSSNLRVPASAGAPSSSPSPGASGSQKRGHSSTTSTSDARPLLAPGVVYEGFLNRNANISVSLSQLTENDSGKGKEREKDVTKGWKAYKVVLKDGKLHFYKPPSNVSDEVKALFPTTVVRGPGASPAASGGRAAAVQYAQELGIDAEALKRGGLGTNALLLATASSANAPTARTPTHSNAGGHQGMPPPLPPKRSGDLPLTSPTKSPGQDAFLSTGQSAARPQWEGAGKHPELLLVDSPHPPSSWAARLRSGSPAAIAHELVFGTQISVDGSKTTTQEDYQRGSDEFFRVVALALLSLDIPLAAFAAELRKWTRTALAVSIGDQVGQEVVNEAESAELSSFQSLVRKRIGRFLEAVCANHGDREGIQAAMEELQGLVRETFADSEEASLKLSQIYDAATPSALAITPTDWSADAMPQLDRARSELAEMATSGRLSGAVLLRLDPAEVAQQIQAFHADRFRALVVPYLRSSDMVKQCARPSLANLFSFDSARPHFLTRLVLDHLLPGGEASPKQSGLSGPSPRHRAALLRHWIAIASYLYSYADLAGWVAISAALCSRAVARLEQTWRFVADGDRHLVGQIWAPKLAQLGWTDGGQRTVLPLLTADGSSQAPVSASGSRIAAIAYFGDVRVELERRWPPLTESRGPTQQVPVADWVGVYGRVDGLVQLWQTQCGGESRALDASSITPAQNAIEEYQIALQAMSAARTDVDVSFYLLHSLQAEPKSLGNLDLRFRSPLPPSMSANAVMPLLFPETLPHLGLLDRDHVHKLASTGDRHAGQSHGPTGTITARSHERVKLSSSPLARSRTFPPGPNARSISGRPIAYAGVVEWSAGGAPDETLLPIGSELVLKAWQEPTSSLPSSPMTSKRFSQELSRRPLSQVSKRSSLPASNRSSYVDPVPLQVVVKAATVERLVDVLVLGVEHLNASVSDDNGEVPLSAQRKTRLSLDMEEYRSTFLATFRSYCTPYVLFELLRKRFCAAVNASREMAIPTIHRSSSQYPSWSMAPHSEPDESVDWDVVSKIRTGVLTVLAAWVKSYAQDFADDPDLFAAWSSFAEHPGVDLVREDAEQARILDTLAELNTSFCVAVMSANTRDEELNGASRANARDSLGTELDFDNASADELVDFLESVASVFYGKILDRDLLVASELLEVQSSDKLGWFVPRKSSAHNGEDEVPTNSMYKLIELLRQPGMGNESATVLQRMPASVRDACAAQNLLRGWTAIQVIEPNLGLARRQARLEKLLDAVSICRARMARLRLGENIASDRDGAQVPFRQATIASFVESAIVGSLTSSESRLFARAWQGVAASRNGSGERLVDLLMPILTPSSKEAAMGISSPDIGWILERLAEAVSRLSDGPDSEHLINFEKYRTVWSLIDSSTHVFPAQVEPALVENAGARLKFMQQALGKVVWDRRLFKEDANHELTSAPFLPLPSKSRSGFKPLAATALAQQDKMRRDRQALEVLLQPDPTSRLSHQLEVVDPAYGAAGNPSAVAPDKSATRGRRMTALFRGAVRPMGLMAEKHEVAARSIAELLALTPTQKASFVAGCAGAHVAVWNNSQRSYVFHLTSEEGGKYLLQAPQQGEMAEWFAHIERAAKEHPATKASDGRKGNKGRYIPLPLYGIDLAVLVERDGQEIPIALERMFSEVEARGLREQGIYRISGAKSAIQALKETFGKQSPESVDLAHGEFSDVHTIAGAIKQWFRDLPEPAIPFSAYHPLIEAERMDNHEERLYAIRDIIWEFPKPHFDLLRRTAEHLARVVEEGEHNLMAPHNIGLVFGTSLLNPAPGPSSVAESFGNIGKAAHIVKIIVTMHEWLFEPEPEPEAEAEAAPATADGANDGNSEVAVVPGSTESLATTAEPIASGPAPAEVREEEDDVEELASPDLEAAVQMPSGIVSHSVTESDAEAPSQNQSARSDLSSEQRPMQVEAAQASTELERKSISETSETSVEVKNSKDRARAFETPQLLETAPSSDGHGMNTSNHGIVTESLSVADASAAGQALARPRRAREGVRDSVYSAYSVYVDALDDSLALERIGRTRLATAQEADESDDAA